MCLGRPAREIRMGRSRRCRRLIRLGKAMQRAKGGQAASCPPAPSLAQPPLSLCFPDCCVVGQKKGLKVKPSLSDRISLPPAPQGTHVPSHACGLVAPFLLEARAAIVCTAHEENHSGGGLPVENENKSGCLLALQLVHHSPIACGGSDAGGLAL